MKKLCRTTWTVARRIALVFFGIIVGLVLVEIGLRVFFWRQLQTEITMVDPFMGWHHQKNWKDIYSFEGHDVPVALNNRGLRRGQPVTLEKLPHTNRIIFVGDSMTAAFEVTEEKTFEALIERKLNERGRQKYEVLNAGVRGYGTDQCELWLTREGIHYQPDAVVYVFCHNDLFDNLKQRFKAHYTIENGQMKLHLPDVAWLRRRHFRKYLYIRRLLRRLRPKSEPSFGLLETAEDRRARSEWFQKVRSMDLHSNEWQLVSHLLQRMNDACRRNGARFYVTSVVMPMEYDDRLLQRVGGNRQRDGEDAYRVHERLATLCQQHRIPFIETLPSFRQYYRKHGDYLWWKADNHYNEKGHALMAEVLYDSLKGSMEK